MISTQFAFKEHKNTLLTIEYFCVPYKVIIFRYNSGKLRPTSTMTYVCVDLKVFLFVYDVSEKARSKISWCNYG